MAKKRKANKAEKAHMDRVAQIGCLACLSLCIFDSPAEIHHVRAGAGGGQRSSHFRVLPLCPPHHRTGGPGVAIHAGQETWEKEFGTEEELLEYVERMLA